MKKKVTWSWNIAQQRGELGQAAVSTVKWWFRGELIIFEVQCVHLFLHLSSPDETKKTAVARGRRTRQKKKLLFRPLMSQNLTRHDCSSDSSARIRRKKLSSRSQLILIQLAAVMLTSSASRKMSRTDIDYSSCEDRKNELVTLVSLYASWLPLSWNPDLITPK
jgi:hypothetical protein